MHRIDLILLSLSCFLFASCSPYLSGSIGVRSSSIDNKEMSFQNPVGQVELGLSHKGTSVFIQHTSSIPDTDESGYGLNIAGIKYTLE